MHVTMTANPAVSVGEAKVFELLDQATIDSGAGLGLAAYETMRNFVSQARQHFILQSMVGAQSLESFVAAFQASKIER